MHTCATRRCRSVTDNHAGSIHPANRTKCENAVECRQFRDIEPTSLAVMGLPGCEEEGRVLGRRRRCQRVGGRKVERHVLRQLARRHGRQPLGAVALEDGAAAVRIWPMSAEDSVSCIPQLDVRRMSVSCKSAGDRLSYIWAPGWQHAALIEPRATHLPDMVLSSCECKP